MLGILPLSDLLQGVEVVEGQCRFHIDSLIVRKSTALAPLDKTVIIKLAVRAKAG